MQAVLRLYKDVDFHISRIYNDIRGDAIAFSVIRRERYGYLVYDAWI